MASNFSFFPMSVTSQITAVPTAATATFWLQNTGGGTGTLQVTLGQYAPSGFRIANVSTVVAFIQFSPPNGTNSCTTANAVPIFPLTVETFRCAGQNAVGYVCSATATLYLTPGEGM